MEERARGRRPVGGELPVCSKTAICKAQRVRTMGACRNCAVYSLRNAVAPKKSRLDDLLSQSPGCKDLYTRLCQNKSDPDAWLIDIYVHFAGGCVADVYTGKKVEPKHDDLVHAKQLFSVVGLTCLMFNNMSPSHASFRFIEDLLFCKRHKPVLTSWGLKKMCQAVCRACEPDPNNAQTMERIVDVKHAIIAQSAIMNNDLSLKRQFNDWCTNFLKIDTQPPGLPQSTVPKNPSQTQTQTQSQTQTPIQHVVSQHTTTQTDTPSIITPSINTLSINTLSTNTPSIDLGLQASQQNQKSQQNQESQESNSSPNLPVSAAQVGNSPNQSEGQKGQKGEAQNAAPNTQTSQSLAQHCGTCLTDQPSVQQTSQTSSVSLQQNCVEFVGQTTHTTHTLLKNVNNPTKRHACPTLVRASKRVRRQP